MATNPLAQIESIKAKIERNEQIRDKAIEMGRLLEDKTAKEQCETQIKESEKYVAYLHEELQQLVENTSTGLTETESCTSASCSSSSSSGRSLVKRMSVPVPSLPTITTSWTGGRTPRTSRSDDTKRRNDRRTSLDLLKANNPINRDRITVMLHDLENKLRLLQRAQADARRVSTTVTANTDLRWHKDAHKKRIDCQEKIVLLKKAIQKYKNINIDGMDSTSSELRPSVGKTTTLVPAAGKLRIKVLEARELTHAPAHTFPITQTYVAVRVTGQREYKTKMSRNDTWMDTFEMDVNKAAEIELVIYDAAGDRNLPIGLLWLRMVDIAEDLRLLKKKHHESPSSSLSNDSHGNGNRHSNGTTNGTESNSNSETDSSQESSDASSIVSTTEGFSEWFNVEPFGRLHLHLNFVRKEAKRIGPINKLRRAGAFKEREGQVRCENGHEFVSGRFYQVMRCAICRDFMVYMTYRCSACHMACHKDCCTRMAARCLAVPDQRNDVDDFKYNIPHRLENITLIGTNWCAHCGLILPLGYRGAKKCTECGIVCHPSCKDFLPDFCGITLDKAYEMWKQYKTTNDRRRSSQLNNIFVRLQMADCQGNFAEGVQAMMHEDKNNDDENTAIGSEPQSPVTTTTPTIQQHLPSQFSIYRMSTPMQLNQRTSLEDFNFLAVLGRGNFGKVMLAENKYTRELYAIKALQKKAIIENDDLKSIIAEKEVFIGANREKHPFLVGLHSTFMTASRVFFVMEYVPGGDLMLHIQGSRFSEPRSRFYCAEVLLALEHLHSKGIIYRDLKLDNVVLAVDGHIKLADYGLCKGGMKTDDDTTTTYCGTPEFMAPEILKDTKYTRAVDWWTLGVLLYEMIVGEAPFKADTESELFEAIINDELECPAFMSRDAQNICHALLQKDPLRRLGTGPRGAVEIRAHAFFRQVKWDNLLAKRVKAPFLPTIKGRADTSNFDQQFTSQFPVLTPVATMLSATQQQNFDYFPYISDWALYDNPDSTPMVVATTAAATTTTTS
ncbi:kinase-like domain-containing protein [Zychaea mexicana]|uniref:kinase-like domain-containing protein n=1 Tax=Zychaea mexicana TaxID=64656 RepID=UPI0022FF1EFF|nr:kinase-like domain-containing protein [Zychaea mexicana]KAI9484761.1 kinase-like domain-containing protein [Zychaea mexicana]